MTSSKNWEIGISTGSLEQITEREFCDCSKAGINNFELSFKREIYDSIPWTDIEKWSKKYNINLWSLHLPFTDGTAITSLDLLERKKAIEYNSEIIKRAADFGIKIFVVHPSDEPINPIEREEKFKICCEGLNQLYSIADTFGAEIAIENLPRTCLANTADELLKILETNDKLRVCFDTNHLLYGTHEEFIKKINNKIITLHVSDYDFIDEKHWFPGNGKIDWKALIKNLEEVDFKGPFLYEVSVTDKMVNKDKSTITFNTYKNFLKNI